MVRSREKRSEENVNRHFVSGATGSHGSSIMIRLEIAPSSG